MAKVKNAEGEMEMKPKELEAGAIIEKIRVKELNYFDGLPILSMREDVLNSAALDYD